MKSVFSGRSRIFYKQWARTCNCGKGAKIGFCVPKYVFFSVFLMKYFQNYQLKVRVMAKRCQAGRAMPSLNFESSYGPEGGQRHANLSPKIAVGILDSLSYKKTTHI